MGRVKDKDDYTISPDENWKSKDPKMLAYEIATFMGGEWPERPIRKIQISLDNAPNDDANSCPAHLLLVTTEPQAHLQTGNLPRLIKSVLKR